MKILYQGGYDKDANFPREDFIEYIKELAKGIVLTNHQVVLPYYHPPKENYIAKKILEQVNNDYELSKKFILYYLPDRIKEVPTIGSVKKYKTPKHWNNERTIQIQYCDCMLAIGGSKGTGDCMEKAFLSKKPVFIAYKVSDYPSKIWDNNKKDYYYLSKGDAGFISDLNQNPISFFKNMFQVLDKIQDIKVVKPKNTSEVFSPKKMRALIASGNIEQSIQVFLKYSKNIDRGLHNQLILLSSQLNNINLNKRLGLKEQPTEEARITFALLQIIDELEELGFN